MGGAHDSHVREEANPSVIVHDFFLDQKLLNKRRLLYAYLDQYLLSNKMPAILALRVMLGLIHLFQLYASPIDKTILANGIV